MKLSETSRSGAAAQAAARPVADARLQRDLPLHQQELESQNLELRRTQLELAAARDRYRDLYERAPVGYLTLDPRGRILEANLTAAAMLAHTPQGLRGRPLSAFMAAPEADRWRLCCKAAFSRTEPCRLELPLRRHDGTAFEGQLDGLRVNGADDRPGLRVTLTDVTLRRQADTDRRAALQVMAEQEAERRRLARVLHDDLGQRLSVLKMNLAGLAPESAAAAVPDDGLAEMMRALDDAVASVRRMATELRPLMLDDLGLTAAVDALAHRSAQAFGLQLTLCLAASDPPPGDPVSVTMYRLLQAVLTQLAGQPGVRGLRVELHEVQGQLVLTVASRRPRRRTAAVALPEAERWTALREGAHLLGYELELQPAPCGAERVTVRLPARSAGAAAPD